MFFFCYTFLTDNEPVNFAFFLIFFTLTAMGLGLASNVEIATELADKTNFRFQGV